MIFDALGNWRRYCGGPAWEMAFAWLDGVAADIAPGEYPIDGKNVYASVFDFTSKNLLDATLEAHRDYADIHVAIPAPLGGPEVQARFDLHELEEETPYDAEKDAALYILPEHFHALFTLNPSQFSVYFPQEGHLTQGKTGLTKEKLRKIVVKIRADLLPS